MEQNNLAACCRIWFLNSVSIKIVLPAKAAFIRYEIENGDDRRKKVALQEIARIYRSGGRFQPETRNGLELIINGLLSTHQDAKVTRWCLNCIAQMGTRQGSMQSVERALRQQDGNPEIIAAAVAAAAKLYAGQLEFCTALGSVQPEIKTLAALQVTHPSKLTLGGLRIDVENADDEVLKLALVAVGLNRSYENMFHPSHSNACFVKALAQHDNIIIRQYSVWCVIENRDLTISDLGIPFDQIESQPPNVQAKMLQLGAEQIIDPRERHNLIERGTFIQNTDAREGLAKGLQFKFYDGLEGVTLDWFGTEGSPRVKELLAEHFARFGSECQPYADKAVELLENDQTLKKRLFLGAEGTRLFGILKSQDLRTGTLDLFSGEVDPLTTIIMEKTNLTTKKVLMMCASPKNEQILRLDQEARDLKEQLRLIENKKIYVHISHAWAIRIDQVQMEILNNKPDILHFSGHGDRDILFFEDKEGNAVSVPASAIAGLVELSDSIECLVLNACYSDSIAQTVKPHVRAVIGCSSSIRDDAAIAFSKAFYRATSHGHSYRKSFQFALNELQLADMEDQARIYTFLDGGKL